jgi:hypothetical protein
MVIDKAVTVDAGGCLLAYRSQMAELELSSTSRQTLKFRCGV